jgi:type II secretory pathway component PulF
MLDRPNSSAPKYNAAHCNWQPCSRPLLIVVMGLVVMMIVLAVLLPYHQL